ncbi:MAG: 30S ribosomal protein S9 [Chloroflexi bacterium]|nr:30S ribosomal protein S9 [Chloroflexota bacterium]
MSEQTYIGATGRRKTSVAQVRIMKGDGVVIINGKPFDELYKRQVLRSIILQPLKVTNTDNKYNIVIKVTGGGDVGQAGAISHGIARALVKANESLKAILRSYGLITRDPRMKERKKYGLKRARKAPQYTKR